MSAHRRLPHLLILPVIAVFAAAACQLFPAQSVPPTSTPLPSHTPLPTYTPPPTYTPFPTYTPLPTYTLPVFYSVDVTFTPTATNLPGVMVRIRNMTGGPVNLYRYGRTGELHFLGWLEHGFYGEFRFPGPDEWRIRYCKRDVLGDPFDCKVKRIIVERDWQEFVVP
jgi:hypothetical protein